MRSKKQIYILFASILMLSLCLLTACDNTISLPEYIKEPSANGDLSDDNNSTTVNKWDDGSIDEQVAYADSTCVYVKRFIDQILVESDTAGCGMKTEGKNTSAQIEVTIENSEWTVYAVDASAFESRDYRKWGVTQSKVKDGDDFDISCGEGLIARNLVWFLPEISQGSIWCYCEAGECKYVIFTPKTSERISTLKGFPSVKSFDEDFFVWNGKTEGVTNEGYVVGTCPKLIQNMKVE